MTRQLILLRHAQAVPFQTQQADASRPLTAEGVAQCAALEKRLESIKLDTVLVSPAMRTIETARQALKNCMSMEIRTELYNASADQMAKIAMVLPAACMRAALVAHNPGISVFANRLSGGTLSDMTPACTISFIVDGEWADLANDICLLDWQFRP